MEEIEHGITEIITTPEQVVVVEEVLEVVSQKEGFAELVERGPQGVPGPPGPAAFISTDPNNMTQEGLDGGIYTPDLVADPVAYYILAKS